MRGEADMVITIKLMETNWRTIKMQHSYESIGLQDKSPASFKSCNMMNRSFHTFLSNRMNFV